MPESADEPWDYSLYIPHDPRAVPISRHTLCLILTAHGLPHLTVTAALLATELIGNAMRHTKGPAGLLLHWEDGTLRIGVWDTDPTPPEPLLLTSADAEEGRGLALVGICADDWGWLPLTETAFGAAGKYVWCELAAAA
ncbi:ATP-binding protein [Streptomyces piniterrae]|uniref:ATP-binding protein n=1 Tax=Streptomyces piniterrae TaxID=2571125 RepID=A0A4U0MWC0_9ACTN|nr:ATP-binding protein [Streptomyces piniterrae]TJZ41464.1 ATP-binding protein [Streptomyces piniterrae]